MTRHLVLVSIGPVQDFIAQARRTRDLWYGSHLLSELSRSAARAIVARGGKLIFPVLDEDELEPCPAPLRPNGQPPVNVANKILAEADGDPRSLAAAARTGAMDTWRSIAADVRDRCAGLVAGGCESVWAEQVDTFLEFTAAWSPADSYGRAREQVEAALAGRKSLRDFTAWAHQGGGAPKSSLDGARRSILAERRPADLVRRYRLGEAEQLDAVGLVKRTGGAPGQFVPLANVALAAWLDNAGKGHELTAIAAHSRELGLGWIDRPDIPWAMRFRGDAQVFMEDRWKDLAGEAGIEGDARTWGSGLVGRVLREMPKPHPYVACLVADGDRVGAAIDALGDAEQHRAFSRALAEFSGRARTIVQERHRGILVYSGGDDVLAFVCLPDAAPCAAALRSEFVSLMAKALAGLEPERWPTLSVGVGVGHVLEAMGDLLALGRQAEREAKRDRDSLALIVDKRSGGRRVWRAPWSADPAGRLRKDIDLLGERLPVGKIHEIERMLRRAPRPDEAPADWAPVLKQEVARILGRVRASQGISPEEAGLELPASGPYASARQAVADWIDRLLVAWTLKDAEMAR